MNADPDSKPWSCEERKFRPSFSFNFRKNFFQYISVFRKISHRSIVHPIDLVGLSSYEHIKQYIYFHVYHILSLKAWSKFFTLSCVSKSLLCFPSEWNDYHSMPSVTLYFSIFYIFSSWWAVGRRTEPWRTQCTRDPPWSASACPSRSTVCKYILNRIKYLYNIIYFMFITKIFTTLPAY